jgi:single-strand DNA-binding protein
MNIAVVIGHLSHPPERRTLPSGEELVGLDVTVTRPDERAESVPVVWPSAPASATSLEVGASVVVVGRVRRRFFRAGASTQSRTEVVAERVLPVRQAAAARRLLAGAVDAVTEGADELGRPRRRADARAARGEA